ncbi:RHS repeat-associated core domain-containing protein [Pseudomonas lini]
MSSPQQRVLCHYHYDPLDRLTGHTLATNAPLQRFYCKTRLATEINGVISQSIVQHGDQLLAQRESSGTARQATLLATDQQRSVLHRVTNSGQHPFAYALYGHRLASNGLLSLLGFNGERPDPVTGHYLLGNGYRAFNPVLMRFNSPDSLSPFEKGGLNSYAYCLGDPINQIDPTGHRSMFPPGTRYWNTPNRPQANLRRTAVNTNTPFPEKSPAWTTDPPPASSQAELRPPHLESGGSHTSLTGLTDQTLVLPPSASSDSTGPYVLQLTSDPPSYESAMAAYPPSYEFAVRSPNYIPRNNPSWRISLPPPQSLHIEPNRRETSRSFFRNIIHHARRAGDFIRNR